MVKTLAEIMDKFSLEEQAEIQERSQQLIAEEMARKEVKKAYELTQDKISQELGITAKKFDKLEEKTDLLLSILRQNLAEMGGNLKLVVEFTDHKSVIINDLKELKNN